MPIPTTLVYVSWFIKHLWQLFIGILCAPIVSGSWIASFQLQPLLFQSNKGNGVIAGDESGVSGRSLAEQNCQRIWCLSETMLEILTGCKLKFANYAVIVSASSLMGSSVLVLWVSDLYSHTSTGFKSAHWGKSDYFGSVLICRRENFGSWESDWQISLRPLLCVGWGASRSFRHKFLKGKIPKPPTQLI